MSVAIERRRSVYCRWLVSGECRFFELCTVHRTYGRTHAANAVFLFLKRRIDCDDSRRGLLDEFETWEQERCGTSVLS